MTSYKLTYFDIDGGRAEPIRIAFHAGKIPFEDIRLPFPEFAKHRESFRFNAVPVLEMDDGIVVSQSNSLARFVGKQAGLYPEDPVQALYCDEAMDAVEDLTNHVVRTFGLEGDTLLKARKDLVDGWLSVFIRGFDDMLTRGGGEYFADGRLTVADLKVMTQMRTVKRGILDHVPVDLVEKLAPALAEHRDRVQADPRVVAYYAR